MQHKHSHWLWRSSGAIVIATLTLPLVGCGSNAPPPPTTSSAPPPASNMQSRPSLGLSTKQKVVLLAGAAALYYYYNKSKKATEAKYAGQQIQYYRSKNGKVYYRDPKTHQAIYIPEPAQAPTYQIPPSEAQQYNGYEGYNNATSGKTLDDAFPAQ